MEIKMGKEKERIEYYKMVCPKCNIIKTLPEKFDNNPPIIKSAKCRKCNCKMKLYKVQEQEI